MRRFTIAFVVFLASAICAVACYAGDVAGKYRYAEKGYTGTMVIENDRFYRFRIDTKDKSSGQMCMFDAVEDPPRDAKDQPTTASTETGVKFKISFKGGNAVIDMIEKGQECGMSGYFGGKYVKAKK